MSTIPITDAIAIVKSAVRGALAPLVLAQQGGSGAPRFYWLRQSLNQYPCVIHQSQDNGGDTDAYLNEAGWSGLWAIKALATDPDTADTWLAAVISGMASLAAPSGYRITARHERPLTIPPSENIWQSAHLYRIYLDHTT